MGHATFTYEFYENEGTKRGLSNVANAIHSFDAYVLRAMHRRCNYNREIAEEAASLIEVEMISRSLGMQRTVTRPAGKAGYYVEQYERSTLVDVVIMPYLNEENVQQLSQEHLEKLAEIINGMLQYQPFPLVTVHDAFAAHPNNVNWVRWQYKEILADIADSDVLNDILSQLYGMPGTFNKLSFNLGDLVRESEYGLS